MVKASQPQPSGRASRAAGSRAGRSRAAQVPSLRSPGMASPRLVREGGRNPLTGLADRQAFYAMLDRLAGEGRPFGLFLIDLDLFRDVNDTLGTDAGDALLAEVADRLGALGAPFGPVARTGGDEFAVVLRTACSFDDLAAAAARLLSEAGFTFLWDGASAECQASIGASLFPDHGRNRIELLRKADIALRQAKAGGRGRAELFERDMLPEIEARSAMLALARRTLRDDALEVHYQPKVQLGTGGLRGFEALLRVCSGSDLLEPDSISAAFDHARLAVQIGRTVRDRVIADVGEWISRGYRFGHVAINATDAEMRDPSWAPLLLHALGKSELPPWTVQVEVTETVLLSRSAGAVRQSMQLLHACGVKIALDDFGTGFASLANLREFPVDTIKVDRSFIAALDEPDSAALVRAIIGLGRALGMEVVAEGVETRAQHEQLRAWGCDQAQGYLYGPAIRQPFNCPITTSLTVASRGRRREKNCSRRSFT